MLRIRICMLVLRTFSQSSHRDWQRVIVPARTRSVPQFKWPSGPDRQSGPSWLGCRLEAIIAPPAVVIHGPLDLFDWVPLQPMCAEGRVSHRSTLGGATGLAMLPRSPLSKAALQTVANR